MGNTKFEIGRCYKATNIPCFVIKVIARTAKTITFQSWTNGEVNPFATAKEKRKIFLSRHNSEQVWSDIAVVCSDNTCDEPGQVNIEVRFITGVANENT